jgi:hypothetical protein
VLDVFRSGPGDAHRAYHPVRTRGQFAQFNRECGDLPGAAIAIASCRAVNHVSRPIIKPDPALRNSGLTSFAVSWIVMSIGRRQHIPKPCRATDKSRDWRCSNTVVAS